MVRILPEDLVDLPKDCRFVVACLICFTASSIDAGSLSITAKAESFSQAPRKNA